MPKTQKKQSPKQVQRFATVTLPDGTKKRIAARGKNEREALKKLAELQADYANGKKAIVASSATFANWAEHYLVTYKAPAVTAATLENHRRIIRLYFNPIIGNIPIAQITPAHIQTCLNEVAGMSADHIKKCYNCVFRIMQQAKISRLAIENPVEYVTIPKGREKAQRRALTPLERKLFLEACKTATNPLIYLATYYCGLRPGEARALRWQDIDLAAGTLSVRHSIERGTEKLTVPKSKAGYRTIPIPNVYIDQLATLTHGAPDQFVFTGTDQHCTLQHYRAGWDKIRFIMNELNGAEIHRNQIILPNIDEDITPYYLRHTYCTMLAEKGVPLKAAQYLMGHSSIQMTANIYTHVTENLLQQSTDILKDL